MLDQITDAIWEWMKRLPAQLDLSDQAMIDIGIGFMLGYAEVLWAVT